MDNTWIFRDRLIKVSLIVVCVVSVFSMTAMIAYAQNKTVITADAEVNEDTLDASGKGNSLERWLVDVSEPDKKLSDIVISCPAGVSLKDISLSARYDLNEMTVNVSVENNHYFLSNPVRGSYENVAEGLGSFDGEKVVFSFALNEPCVCELTYINNEVNIELTPISSIQVPIVIVDAGHGGTSLGTKVNDVLEKDINLAIAKMVCEYADDSCYKVILVRDSDDTMTVEERLNIIEAVGADYYIGVHLDSDVDNTKQFGISAVYNSGYYRNGIQNAEYADCLVSSIAKSTSNRGLWLKEATDTDIVLKVVDIPAADIYCGYMSNSDELSLLKKDEYIDKIAKGIVDALDNIIGK